MFERLIAAPRVRSLVSLGFCLVLGFALSGCALGRSVVDITPPTSMMSNGTVAVKIVDVRDARMFEAEPSQPSTPSLQTPADISNPMITARALGRKRGGYGNALGDVVLPEGRTVTDLVRAATRKALQDKGYRVVEQGSPEYAAAASVSVDVREFWAWFTPGAFVVDVECRAQVNVNGGMFTGANPSAIEGYAKSSGLAATDSTFAGVVTQALNDLSVKMTAQIRAP